MKSINYGGLNSKFTNCTILEITHHTVEQTLQTLLLAMKNRHVGHTFTTQVESTTCNKSNRT